jgi:hypothetical protein
MTELLENNFWYEYVILAGYDSLSVIQGKERSFRVRESEGRITQAVSPGIDPSLSLDPLALESHPPYRPCAIAL